MPCLGTQPATIIRRRRTLDKPRTDPVVRVYARRSLLCAGATERLIGFADNDRPGIMQAGAVRGYVNRFAAAPAEHVAVFTNNDDGHRTATDLAAAGVDVAAIIDSRPDAPKSEVAEVFAGAVVSGTGGRLGIGQVDIRLAGGGRKHVQCGVLAVSGGWNPQCAPDLPPSRQADMAGRYRRLCSG